MPSLTKTKRMQAPKTQNDHRRYASFSDLKHLFSETLESTQRRINADVKPATVQLQPTPNVPQKTTGVPIPPGSDRQQKPISHHDVPASCDPIQEHEHPYAALVNQLTESVCADYRMCRMRRAPWRRKTVLFAFNEDVQRLAGLAGQMRQFADRFVRALLELRDDQNCSFEERQRLVKARVHDILTRIDLPPFLPQPQRLKARYFTALRTPQLFADLRQSLIATTRAEIQAFVNLLGAMQQTGIVGRITFDHPDGLSFCYHRFPMIFRREQWHDAQPKNFTTTVQTSHSSADSGGGAPRLETRTQQIKETQNILQHREARHEIELLNPRTATLQPHRLRKAPTYVHDVVMSVPDAFKPHLEIVSGIRTDEEVTERDGHTEPWQQRTVEKETVTVHVIDPDPGIKLGPFVLVAYHGR